MSYLSAVLVFGMMWIYLWIRHYRLRGCLLASSLLFLPAGFTEALFVPDYWEPEVIWRYGRLDLESLFFAFFTGGIASVLYPAVFRCDIRPAAVSTKGLRLHLFWLFPMLAAVVLVGIGTYTDIPVIPAALGIFLFGIIHMLLVRPDLLRASAGGALLFFLAYTAVLIFSLLVYGASFISAWTAHPLFGWRILDIPLDEYLYALLFGGLWASVYCGIFNRQFVRLPQEEENGFPGRTRWAKLMGRIS